MIDLVGKKIDPTERDFIQKNNIRAVCLFRKNLGSEDEIRALTDDLAVLMGPNSLIAIDQEGGGVVRATSLPAPPSALCLAQGGDLALTEQVGEAVGRGLLSLGINWNFAPVLDVNNNLNNPVIAERSFGADSATVTRFANAWMKGCLRAGVATCVKHFPGHGDTAVDSHFSLPLVDKSHAELEATELAPFYALHAFAPAIMSAHIVYPQIDARYPATLSRTFLHDILRNEWAYEGVIITDSLQMKAIEEHYGSAEAAVLALAAGADMVMVLGSIAEQTAAIDALCHALATEQLTIAALTASQEALNRLAQKFPALPYAHTPSYAPTYSVAQRATDETLMQVAWAAGFSVFSEKSSRQNSGGNQAIPPTLPTRPAADEALAIYLQGDVSSNGVSESGLAVNKIQALFAGFSVRWHIVPDLGQLRARDIPIVEGERRILVSNYRRRYHAHAQDWPFDLHLVLWNPFVALDVPVPAIVTFGFGTGALVALRQWLIGKGQSPKDWAPK